MQDGVRDRVGAERQTADGDDVEIGDQVEHDAADGRGGAVVEGELAHVDVVRRLLAAGEGEIAVEHRLLRDESEEGLAVCVECGHGIQCRRHTLGWTHALGHLERQLHPHPRHPHRRVRRP